MSCRVSVIVPVYNCKSYLSRAVDSVVNQKDFYLDELILVDDGSDDGSDKICDSYSSEFVNVKVIHQCNLGVSAARNAGINVAEGEWIFFLDSDDYILPGAFENMLKYSAADMITGKHLSNKPFTDDTYNYFPEGIYNTDEIRDKLNDILIHWYTFFTCWSRLYKSEIINKYNIRFPENIKYAEDMTFVYLYIKHCKNLAFTDSEVYYYFVNEKSSTAIVKKSFDVIYYIYCWHKKYFADEIELEKQIDSVLVYKTFTSIKIPAYYMSRSEAVSNISSILNNEDFYNCYIKEDYKKFSCKTDEFIDKYIRMKKADKIYLVIQLCKIKSEILNKLGG